MSEVIRRGAMTTNWGERRIEARWSTRAVAAATIAWRQPGRLTAPGR
ncbi:hypothetical protein [Lentzea albidocapillata]|nr:hypothetical protein [Lentzea albidocapillata]